MPAPYLRPWFAPKTGCEVTARSLSTHLVSTWRRAATRLNAIATTAGNHEVILSSEAPLSSAPMPPKQGGSAQYIVGIVLLLGLSAALLWYRMSSSEEGSKPEPKPAATASSEGASGTPVAEFAPPPPPDEEEEKEAANEPTPKDKASVAGKGKARAAGPSPCGKCGSGISTAALNSAVRRQAGMARGCYNRALKRGGAQGSMTVSVSVGSSGAICGVSVVADSVNNGGIRACVVGKFRSASYPKPKEGCVTVNVPISFKMK